MTEYHLTVQTLRKVLRKFQSFDTNEIETVALLIDLRDALGFNPMITPAITARQRQVIQVHLIEDRTGLEAARLLGFGTGRRQMWLVEQKGLENILAYLKGERSEYRKRQWRPWQIALLYDGKLSLSELATKIGKSELAVKLMMSRLRKQNEAIPFRRHFSGRTVT